MPWTWKSAVRHAAGKHDLDAAIKSWRKILHKEIKEKDEYLTSTLELIGSLVERRGMVRIGKKDEGGWDDLYLGWRYRAWHLVVTASQYEDWVRDGAMGCALALTYGDAKFAVWSRDQVLKKFPKEEVIEEEEAFIINLCHQWKHGRPVLEANSAFDAVFDAWNQPKKLASAIQGVCNYHCAHCRSNGRRTFCYHPYTVIPAEVLAVYRVRDSLGLATPQVNHPLLDQVFAQPPPMPTLPADRDLEAVVALSKSLEPKRADLKRKLW
jgi:hypothetical protein